MSQIYFTWSNTLHVSDGLSVHHQEFKSVHRATGICQTDTADCRQQYMFDKCLLLYVQSWTPDDGRKDRPKHVVLLTYLPTPWCRVLLEKLTGLQLVKKFSAFHGTRRFITAHKSVRHLSLSWASPIQSIYPHPTSRRSIPILSTHLRLGLPSGLLPSGFPTKTLYTPRTVLLQVK